ncbi:MAG TPA: hypothetical protein IAB56_05175 [Candidatus Scybalousia intestinigallinarum]|nr:hypothetical protein [Candidatus Scybalousia intestinigallinarum]
MEILFNEESGKFYPEGKDQDFIHTILAFLYANGVEIINKNSFIQNLIYYREDPRFKEWFQTIGKLNFFNGFEREERESGNVGWMAGSNFVYLSYQNELDNYKKYQGLFEYERYLKEEIKKLLQLTKELTTICLIEQEHEHSIRIYATDPNSSYSLVKEAPFNLYSTVESTFLITDGNTTMLNTPKSSDRLEVNLENAKFAIVLPSNKEDYHTDYKGFHGCVDIYTKISSKKQLQELATIGENYRGKKDKLLSEETYVKKLSF